MGKWNFFWDLNSNLGPVLERCVEHHSGVFVEVMGEYIFLQNALNCWVAALLYLVTLLFSVSQFYLNNRQTYSV